MRERAVGSRDLENWSWRLVVEKAWIIGDGEKNRGISPESQLRLPGGRRPFLRQSRAGLHPLPASPASRAHLMVCYSSDSQCDSTPLYYYGSKVDTYCKSSSILISQIPVQGLSGRQDSRLTSTTVHLLRTPPIYIEPTISHSLSIGSLTPRSRQHPSIPASPSIGHGCVYQDDPSHQPAPLKLP